MKFIKQSTPFGEGIVFFVHLTKVLHIFHAIVMTSDTFFIEDVYTDSALKNTSEYYLVDFFNDETALKILKEHGFSYEDARCVVDWMGGVPWMLERIVLEKDPRRKDRKYVKELVEREILYYDPMKEVLRFQVKLDERVAKRYLQTS